MKPIISVLALVSNAEDAPRKADYGHEILNKGERLLISFSVHAKVLIQKGGFDKPLYPKMPLPLFPSEAINMGLLGESVVSFTVKEDGSVDSVQAEKSTDKMFEQASLAAVSQWTFAHPECRGKTAQLALQVTFIFSRFEEQD